MNPFKFWPTLQLGQCSVWATADFGWCTQKPGKRSIAVCSALIGFIFCCCVDVFSATARADTPNSAASEKLVLQALKENIWQEQAWEKLLYYVPTWFRGRRSLIDSPQFFVDPNGKSDARAELLATLRAFFEPEKGTDEDNAHARCRYPARFHYLDSRLGLSQHASLPRPRCSSFEMYSRAWDRETLSVVFSDYYLNNPVSLFGHVFIRLGGQQKGSQLLDLALSFAADINGRSLTEAMLTGPFGGLPGRFYVHPYYLKVQEYNNAEGRDLWEYTLDFSPEQTAQVFRSIWEIEAQTIDYWYLDDNCALALLAVLDAGRPELDLAGKLMTWVTPADTIKVLASAPGLIANTVYRPSSLSRFKERQNALSENETDVFERLVKTRTQESLEEAAKLSEASARRVLDAGIEFIDHDQRLAAGQQPESEADRVFRSQLLASRARLHAPSPRLQAVPATPLAGHDTKRIGLGWVAPRRDGQISASIPPAVGFDFRGALHDLSSPLVGYPPGVAIEFFHLNATLWPADEEFRFERFKLFSVWAAQNFDPLLMNFAWHTELGWARTTCTKPEGGLTAQFEDRCGITYGQGGIGAAFLFGRDLGFYAYPLHGRAGWHSSQGVTADLTPTVGVHAAPWRTSRVHVAGSLERRISRRGGDSGPFTPALTADGSQMLGRNIEFRLSAHFMPGGLQQGSITSFYYF